jgi:Exonuclease VII small subunit.
MKKEEMSYEQAIGELEKLVGVIEDKDAPLKGVEEEIKRAMELIEICKKELRGYEETFNKLLEE